MVVMMIIMLMTINNDNQKLRIVQMETENESNKVVIHELRSEMKDKNKAINELSLELETKNKLINDLNGKMNDQEKIINQLLSNNNETNKVRNDEEEEKKEETDKYQVLKFDAKYKSDKVALKDNNKSATGHDMYCWILAGGDAITAGVRVWRFKVMKFTTIYAKLISNNIHTY